MQSEANAMIIFAILHGLMFWMVATWPDLMWLAIVGSSALHGHLYFRFRDGEAI